MKLKVPSTVSILPPALEQARQGVELHWLWLLYGAQALFFVFMAVLLSCAYHETVSVWAVLAFMVFYAAGALLCANAYLGWLSKKLGYICLCCRKPIFQLLSLKRHVEVTGRCPSCNEMVAYNLDEQPAPLLRDQHQQALNKSFVIHTTVPAVILIVMFCYYGALRVSHDARAVDFLASKNYDSAIAELNQALQSNPHDIDALTYRGYAYAQKHDYEHAMADENQAISGNPDNFEAFDARCVINNEIRAFDAAIKDCTQAIKLGTDKQAALLNRSQAYEATNQHTQARQDIEQAIALSPDKATLYAMRGIINMRTGLLDDARKDFAKAQTIAPDDGNLLFGRGILNAIQGLSGDAITDLENALRQDSGNPYAMIWLHLAKLHSNQNDQPQMQQLAAAAKENAWPWSLVALYAGQGNPDEVKAQMATGTPAVQETQACEGAYYLGEYYLQINDRDAAKVFLQTAINACPQAQFVEKQAAAKEFNKQNF